MSLKYEPASVTTTHLPLEVEVHVGDAGEHHGDVDLAFVFYM